MLTTDKLSVVKWWLDTSYAAYNDICGHTGATMSMVNGSVLSVSKKQNLNTRISTKNKLIGEDDALPQMLWTKYYIRAKGWY